MKYRLINIEEDDFIAEVLSELTYEIGFRNDERMKVTESARSKIETKGSGLGEILVEIVDWCNANEPVLNVLEGVIAAGVYDMLKKVAARLRKAPEYIPEKKIKIVQEDSQGGRKEIEITIRDILEKDVR